MLSLLNGKGKEDIPEYELRQLLIVTRIVGM